MGSPQEGATAGKPPNPKATAAPATTAASSAALPPATAVAPVMMPFPDWSAYYASGVAPSAPATAFFPAAPWAGQPIQYGTGIPFSPIYYGHTSMSAGTPYPNAEDGRPSANKSKRAARGKSADGGKVTSGSGDDDATESGESGSEGSSASGDESAEPQDLTIGRKRTKSDASKEGEAAQGVAQYNSTTPESSHSGRVPKLPVSAPGRAALSGPATNLNIGMDVWNAQHAGPGALMVAPNMVGIAPVMPGREGVMPEHQWMKMDEREMRREKRKQSNRESARRSRMRKQQECEELAKKVTELQGENNALRVEVERRRKDLEELGDENASLMANLKEKNPGLLTDEEHSFLLGREEVAASEASGFVQSPVGLTVNSS